MVSRSLSLSRSEGSRANTKGECQVEWSSPGTRETYISSRMSGILGGIPGGIVVGFEFRYSDL